MNLLRRPHRRAGMTVHEIAAEWLSREEAGRLSSSDRLGLDDWLAADLAHRRAFEDVRLAMSVAAHGAADPELMAMRAHALAARPQRDWMAPRAAAALLLAAVLGAGGWWMLRGPDAPELAGSSPGVQAQVGNPNSAQYRTAIGERAVITLPDGSLATLDTDSEFEVAYTGSERGVRLLRGRALFEVAKHKPIPFQVDAGAERVTAVGTKFEVRLDGAGKSAKVRVVLVEGVVKVTTLTTSRDHTAPREVVTMAAGEVLEAKDLAPVTVVAIDADRATSWRAGLLTFDDVPLEQAVAEMNRYTTRPVGFSDSKLARLRVSGVFKTGDPEHFAETVSAALPVQVAHRSDGSVELEPRN